MKKAHSVLFLASLMVGSSLFGYNLPDNNHAQYGTDSFMQQIKERMKNSTKSSSVYQHALKIQEVHNTTTATNTASKIATTQNLVAKNQNTVKADMSSSSRIYRGAKSSSTVKPTVIKLAAAGAASSGAAAAPAGLPVQAICGAENFDDVVKATYGVVSLSRQYVDATHKACVLGKMKLYLKTAPLGYGIIRKTKISSKWVHFPSNTKYVVPVVTGTGSYAGRIQNEHTSYLVSSSVNSFPFCTGGRVYGYVQPYAVPFSGKYIVYQYRSKRLYGLCSKTNTRKAGISLDSMRNKVWYR